MNNAIVKKHNALNTASYSLNLCEQRLIWIAIVESKGGRVGIDASNPLSIHASSYAKHFGVSRQTAYQALKEAAESLFERRFSFAETPDDQNTHYITSRWVSQIGYRSGDPSVTMIFSPAVIPLITELERQFTYFELSQVKHLSSAYAGRLYELLIQWRSIGQTPVIELKDLREQVGVVGGEYPRVYDLKRFVIDLALKQINTHTDITASYEQHKRGRMVTGFSFSFQPKPAVKTVIKPKAPKKPKKKTPAAYGDEVINHLNMTRDAVSAMASKMSFLPDDQLPAELVKLPPPKRANQMLHTLSNPETWQELMPQLKAVDYKTLID